MSWLSGLLSAEIFISTGEWGLWGGPDATPDLWKQPFSAVRASGGYPGNDIFYRPDFTDIKNDYEITCTLSILKLNDAIHKIFIGPTSV